MKKKRYRENYPITKDRGGRLFKRDTQGKNNCKYNNNENNNKYTNSGKRHCFFEVSFSRNFMDVCNLTALDWKSALCHLKAWTEVI